MYFIEPACYEHLPLMAHVSLAQSTFVQLGLSEAETNKFISILWPVL
jgi:hypothetical protein